MQESLACGSAAAAAGHWRCPHRGERTLRMKTSRCLGRPLQDPRTARPTQETRRTTLARQRKRPTPVWGPKPLLRANAESLPVGGSTPGQTPPHCADFAKTEFFSQAARHAVSCGGQGMQNARARPCLRKLHRSKKVSKLRVIVMHGKRIDSSCLPGCLAAWLLGCLAACLPPRRMFGADKRLATTGVNQQARRHQTKTTL